MGVKLEGYNEEDATTAARDGDKKTLELIGKQDPEIFRKEDRNGDTAVSWAAIKGHRECLQVIAEYASDTLGQVNGNGETPAYWARKTGRLDCLEKALDGVKQKDIVSRVREQIEEQRQIEKREWDPSRIMEHSMANRIAIIKQRGRVC